jgi:hypothetical protein
MGCCDATSTGGSKLLRRWGFVALFGEPDMAVRRVTGRFRDRAMQRPSPKKTHSKPTSGRAGDFIKGDSMSDTQTELLRPVPSIAPSKIPAMSDDECLVRLAQAVKDHDSDRLDEVARLIGRLVVTIE